MFERFTEKAVNVVIEAQRVAKEMKSSEVLPEHLLLALVTESRGVSLKIFRMYNLTEDTVKSEILKYTSSYKMHDEVPFSHGVKEILKRTLDLASKSGNQNILFEHLFLSVITDRNSNIQTILEHFCFDKNNARDILNKLVQKKVKRLAHPESEEVEEKTNFESVYGGEALTDVLNKAVSKLSSAGYEILGTEQIVSAILESDNSVLTETIRSNGLNPENFAEGLSGINSRDAEYNEKKIIFTPNAFLMMNLALQTAKELGSSIITPEHVMLSLLKTKKGLAYEVIKSLGINEEKLYDEIMKPIEKQMPETLIIMKLAKEEARRIGRNVVGTEMFLLGILAEGTSDAYIALSELDVTLKDARLEVENLIGYGNEYFDKEIIFTPRAKKVLEKAWIKAKKADKQRIEAMDLLNALINEPDSIAMKVLDNLGVDSAEIRHGIERD